MTQMLALELAKHRIRVNVICPGAIDTDIQENTAKRHIEAATYPPSFHWARFRSPPASPAQAKRSPS